MVMGELGSWPVDVEEIDDDLDACFDDYISPGEVPFTCTRPDGHEGNHMAGGQDGVLYDEWARGSGLR